MSDPIPSEPERLASVTLSERDLRALYRLAKHGYHTMRGPERLYACVLLGRVLKAVPKEWRV